MSAVLLIPIKSDVSYLGVKPIGLLHPKPFHSLNPQVFPDISFAQIVENAKDFQINWIDT